MITRNTLINLTKSLIMPCILLFLLIGCTEQAADLTKQNSALQGYALEEINYTIDLDKLNKIADPNNAINYEPFYDLIHVEKGLKPLRLNDVDIDKLGNLTILGYNFADNEIDTTFMPMLYIQGFRKENSNNNEVAFKINDVKYSRAEISQYILYEDAEVVVLDITKLLPIKDFNNEIDRMQANSSRKYDYKWLTGVYEYLKSYKDIHIQPAK